jgi:hypothetical protein
LWRRPWLRQYHRFIQRGLLVQVSEYLLDDHWIFDAGNDFNATAAFGTGGSTQLFQR